MNRLEHLLTIGGEECNEIGQRFSKAARFGMLEIQPGQSLTNRERILGEFADLCGALELMTPGATIDGLVAVLRPQIDAKKAKVEKFLLYSEKCGTLTP